jgi:hypothetical protein
VAVPNTHPLGELRFVLPPAKGGKSRAARKQIRATRVIVSERNGRNSEPTYLIAPE